MGFTPFTATVRGTIESTPGIDPIRGTGMREARANGTHSSRLADRR